MRRETGAVASRAAAALLIRRAAAPLLLHGIGDAEAWARAAECDDDAWKLFLGADRCALPLQRALARAPSLAPRRAAFHDLLARAARPESARILVVRSHLQTMASLAASGKLRIIVLKGAVLAMSGEAALDLTDLDVLLQEEQASALAAALHDMGWIAKPNHTNDRVSHTLVARGMAVEIHRALNSERPDDGLWDRSEPLEAMPLLCRLGPQDDLRYLVQHVALGHPNRRMRLRDLMLIAQAARRCSARDVDEAFAEPGSYTASVSRAALDTAVGRMSSDAKRDDERRAVTMYVVASRPVLPFVSRTVAEYVDAWSIGMLQTAWERREIWASARIDLHQPSNRWYLRMIQRQSATVGRVLRLAWRNALLGATWVLSRVLVANVRRTIERALASPSLLEQS